MEAQYKGKMKIKNWLKKKKLSYHDFAQRTGFSEHVIARWANGTQPRPVSLRLVKVFFPDFPV